MSEENKLITRKYKIMVGSNEEVKKMQAEGKEPKVLHEEMPNYYDVIYFCVGFANEHDQPLTVIDLSDKEMEEFPPGYTIVDER